MRVTARRMLATAGSATALSAALSAFLAGPAEAAPPLDTCDALRLTPQLVGKALTTHRGPVHAGEIEVQSLDVTRAIRILRPEDQANLSFAADRLTIVTDNTDHVTRVFCG